MDPSGQIIPIELDTKSLDIYNPFGLEWKVLLVAAFIFVMVIFAIVILRSIKNSGQ